MVAERDLPIALYDSQKCSPPTSSLDKIKYRNMCMVMKAGGSLA
jgi:hypothetical protein